MKWWKKVFFHLFSLTVLNAYILYKERTKITCPTRGTCEGAYNNFWHFSLSYSKRLSKEVRRKFDMSPTWISFPRESTGHWEEDQHHLILCSLFFRPEEDFGKDRREEEEARKRVRFSVHCLQSGLGHPKLQSAVLYFSVLCCYLRP